MKLSDAIEKARRDPSKIGRFLGVQLRMLPYRLRLASLLPRSISLAHAPDRYTARIDDYLERQAPIFEKQDRGLWTRGNAKNYSDITRYYFLTLACDQLLKEGIDGDIAELGVYKGNSACILAKLARATNKDLYLFDTFDSFDRRDLEGTDAEVDETAFSDTSLEGVRRLVGDENVCYIAGYFPESLSLMNTDPRYCLVHIDCDLYAPFAAGLEHFYPRLVPGGMLIMHDYGSLVWEGAEKAVDEFFADKPERPIVIPDKSGTAVIRKMVS
jgi:O-methyltransferase